MQISIEQMKGDLATAVDDLERLRLMNALALALTRVDPSDGLRYAEAAEELAQELKEDESLGEALRAAAFCHETLCDYPTAMKLATRARESHRRAGNRTGEARCLNAIGVIANGMTDYSAALTALAEARELFNAERDLAGAASACNNFGMVHQELGNFADALSAYLEALRINEDLGLESLVAVNLGNVSNIYYYLGDYEKSFEYDSRALDIARRRNDLYGIAHTLESIASNYKQRGEYDAALRVLEEALSIFCGMNERRYEAAALIKVGALHESRNEPKEALKSFQRAMGIAEEIGKEDIVVNARLHIGTLHVDRRANRKAIPVLRKALAGAREGGMARMECELMIRLATALHAVGESAEAFTLMSERAALLEQLYGEQQRRAVAEMQARFDVERAERQRDMLSLRNEHLEEMMKLRSKELTSMAMRLVQKNAFLQKLRKETIQLAAEQPAAQGALEKLVRAIVENLHGDDEWSRFEQEFQHVHHDFIRRLANDYPRLSPTELKVCALLKVNLSNKEIANLLSVSLRNVESHRYSIRKKMGLPSETNLAAHLAGM